MNKIKEEDLCYFDPLNTLLVRAESTVLIKVIKIERKLFKKDIYKCISLQNGNTILCNKDILYKVSEEDINDHKVIVRIDETSPYITNTDIRTVEDCLSLLGSSDSDIKQRLTMLESKLKFYSQVRDI